jgi:Domain of unknown function (DUF1963)
VAPGGFARGVGGRSSVTGGCKGLTRMAEKLAALNDVSLNRAVPSIQLLSKKDSDGTAASAISGGYPNLPPHMDWPRDESGQPMQFIIQIDCAALPRSIELDDRTLAMPDLPAQGTLFLFAGCLSKPACARVLYDRGSMCSSPERAPPPDLRPLGADARISPNPWWNAAMEPLENIVRPFDHFPRIAYSARARLNWVEDSQYYQSAKDLLEFLDGLPTILIAQSVEISRESFDRFQAKLGTEHAAGFFRMTPALGGTAWLNVRRTSYHESSAGYPDTYPWSWLVISRTLLALYSRIITEEFYQRSRVGKSSWVSCWSPEKPRILEWLSRAEEKRFEATTQFENRQFQAFLGSLLDAADEKQSATMLEIKLDEAMRVGIHASWGYLRALGLNPDVPEKFRCEVDGARVEEHMLLGLPVVPNHYEATLPYVLLFRISSGNGSGMLWGDVNRLHILIKPDDLAAACFDEIVPLID